MVALMTTETYLWRQRGLIYFMVLYLAMVGSVSSGQIKSVES